MAELVPVYNKRERRLRNLGKLLFITSVIMVSLFILSLKVSIIDNDLTYEWVTFENNKGDELSGLLLTPRDVPEEGAPAVIVVHDLTGHKEHLNRISFELARHGFIVLALDLRDHGRSQGETTYGDYYEGEPRDIVAAYNYLTTKVPQVNYSRIGLVGDGFGGAQVLMATNILLEQNMSVGATVAWGPPLNVTDLYNGNWDDLERYVDRRVGDVNWDYEEGQRNRSAILHMDSENWVSENVYIIYGQGDPLIPVEQFARLNEIANTTFEVEGMDHALSEDEEVLKFTIDFLYRTLEKTTKKPIEFNYKEVEAINSMLNVSSIAVMVIAFLMTYEVIVTKRESGSYIPMLSKKNKPLKLGMATMIDIVAYAGIAFMMSGVHDKITDGMFMDILPAARFFTTALIAGIALVSFGIAIWYMWSHWLPRDEELAEETCGSLRGVLLSLFALLIIIINYLFGQLLLFGPNYPKEVIYLIPMGIAFVFFLGHEIWMRKLLHPKINALLSYLFIKRKWTYHLTFFFIMYGLYALLALAMLSGIGKSHFGPDFGIVYGGLVTVVGFVATVIYHRSKSILASVTYSLIIAPWLLNLMYHF